MYLEVLMSCMNKKEFSIIEESNLKDVNTLIVNQCDKDEQLPLDSKHRVINTTSRGLSVSRNIPIDNANGDICLLCDDDEIFIDDLAEVIQDAYDKIQDADIIAFKVCNWPEVFGGKTKRLSKIELLKISSVQISFKRKSVLGKIKFDSFLGAGTKNGSGEENKFLLECHKIGLKIYYMPIDILSLIENESTWFSGFNEDYFYKRGYTTRYIYGLPFSILYNLYFVLSKRKIYRNDTTFNKAAYYLFKGMKDNCIMKQKLDMQ